MFLAENHNLVAKFVAAHRELTDWIKVNPQEAQWLAREELLAETRSDIEPQLIARSWQRIMLTTDISAER